MQRVTLLLPLLTFLAILTLVWGSGIRSGNPRLTDWRRAFLRSSVIGGLLLIGMGEGLSVVRGLERLPVALYWLAVLGVVLVWLWRSGAGGAVLGRWRAREGGMPSGDCALLAGMLVAIAMLALIGWLSPASNVDSLLYHMSRVVHWAQGHSLSHYPTVYTFQLSKPYWAELAILNLRLLWGSDRPAALVQWGAMVGSLIVASWAAKLIGAERRGQILAALFALSVPMGLLQATSTQNDYVAAFWTLSLLAVVAQAKLEPIDLAARAELGGIVGLGMLTKGTFPVYALPILAWHFVPMLWREKPKRWLLDGAIVLAIVILCNLGFWSRNLATFGGPYGPSDWLRTKLTFLPLPAATAPELPNEFGVETPVAPPGIGPSDGVELPELPPDESVTTPATGVVQAVLWPVGRWARYLTPNLVTPVGGVNAVLWRVLAAVPALIPPENLEVMRGLAWNHEDSAGNPLHLLLVVVSLGMLLAHPKTRTPAALGMAMVTLAGSLLIPLAVGGGAARWGLRYQLPFFISWAPIFGFSFSRWLRGRASLWVGAALLLASLPYLLLNNTRPLIGIQPWPTRTRSVLTAPASELAFAILAGSKDPGKAEALLATADLIEARQCSRVGLRIDSNGLEYLYWWVLGAPQSGIELQVLNPIPESKRFADPTFSPCVVVCTICTDETEIDGLPRITDFGGISLYGLES